MWMIVGLGNPGEQYIGTRHNIGFMVIDSLPNLNAITLKPQTFMNRSGEAVIKQASFYKIPPGHIIVVHDEMDLSFGDVRIKKSGGHGGHNGLRDIIRVIGADFIRVRMGIGKPAHKGTEADYVLSNFRKDERDEVKHQIVRAIDTIKAILELGVDKAQAEFNQKR